MSNKSTTGVREKETIHPPINENIVSAAIRNHCIFYARYYSTRSVALGEKEGLVIIFICSGWGIFVFLRYTR